MNDPLNMFVYANKLKTPLKNSCPQTLEKGVLELFSQKSLPDPPPPDI